MQTQCPKCKQRYEIDESMIGQIVECSCGNVFTITSAEKTKICPMCGESILAVAKKCKHCGEYLDGSNPNKPQKYNRIVYVLLGLFLGGFGVHNFYARQFVQGILKVIFTIITFVVAANCSQREPAWISPAAINGFMVIFDLCFDPNTPVAQRKKICGLRPSLFVFLVIFFIFSIIGIINAKLE